MAKNHKQSNVLMLMLSSKIMFKSNIYAQNKYSKRQDLNSKGY